MKNIILSVILGFMCISCCSNKYAAVNISGQWKIEKVLGTQVNLPEEEAPFIAFQKEESRFYGNTGCNSFFGEFNTTEVKNEITISNLGSTKKLCVDMSVEDAIFSALSQITSVEYDNNNMLFKDKDGKILMELSSTDIK